MLIPLISWNVNRSEYYRNYGAAIYAEDYYRIQQEAANNNYGYYNNNNGNNNNGNNANNGYYTYYKECSWYNCCTLKSDDPIPIVADIFASLKYKYEKFKVVSIDK